MKQLKFRRNWGSLDQNGIFIPNIINTSPKNKQRADFRTNFHFNIFLSSFCHMNDERRLRGTGDR